MKIRGDNIYKVSHIEYDKMRALKIVDFLHYFLHSFIKRQVKSNF